ncbi:sigma-54-dependent Fis family transcriptional regulator [Ruficoccus amylovorans]|uniref:Sigma-54-dependent Fis family transcriptional regulator n=1 Tax=Ruficoccus amylovorans TaxID=1804625 RepID=A0A842HID5_9BACT|nr:sigma-54 dependent transcriptional regulator [Ruficoccus amylovorans]MBC2594981.1 sigma-54-dependent Fis family transcriptional regulator [Ruficoccus amylovorans]
MRFESALVVDDELIIRRTLQQFLQRKRLKVKTVASIQEALEQLGNDHDFEVMFLDLNLPDGLGTDLLEQLAARGTMPVTIMITAQGSIESAVKCMKLGAFDYLQKPFSIDELDLVLSKADRYEHLQAVNKQLAGDSARCGPRILGNSPRMAHMREMIDSVARTDATVLVHGKTGTGKELVAQEIHRQSMRRDKPFIRVNCAAVSESLIESEFFGHVKGAFTGAFENRIGRFELAHGGTLLLDEISEISLPLQAKLLRVLQEREFERVGSSNVIQIDTRIVATTNRDLQQSVVDGDFRQDLYYRLNVFPIESPPLREREGDIPLLAQHFLETYTRKHRRNLTRFHPDSLHLMQAHTWPGNVRELQNIVERAVILSTKGPQVTPNALPLELQLLAKSGTAPPSVAPNTTAPAPVAVAVSPPISPEPEEICSLEDQERRLILRALEHTGGNRTTAAEKLQISVRTLRNKLSLYREQNRTEFEPFFNN